MTAARDWTVVSFHYRDPVPVSESHPGGWMSRCERWLAETGLKSEAAVLVDVWLDAHPERGEHLHSVNYYPRNYVDMARQLRAAGRVIARPAEQS